MSQTSDIVMPSKPEEKYHDRKGAVEVAHQFGLKYVTEGTIVRAAYYGRRALKRTKIGNRVYYAQSDIEAWIESCKLQDND